MSALTISKQLPSLPKLSIQIPEPPQEFQVHAHLFIKYLTHIYDQFHSYSIDLTRTMERAYLEADHERLNQIQILTSELLKATNRFHLRGGLEFIRDNKLSQRSSSVIGAPVDKLMKNLLADESFLSEFMKVTADNNLVFQDTSRALLGLYHSLSKYAHGSNTDTNIFIDAQILVPLEQFCIGVLFKRYNISYGYLDKQGKSSIYPYNLSSITSGH